jgi:hypothetical protein
VRLGLVATDCPFASHRARWWDSPPDVRSRLIELLSDRENFVGEKSHRPLESTPVELEVRGMRFAGGPGDAGGHKRAGELGRTAQLGEMSARASG